MAKRRRVSDEEIELAVSKLKKLQSDIVRNRIERTIKAKVAEIARKVK